MILDFCTQAYSMAVAKILHKIQKVSKKINSVLGAVESTRAFTFQPIIVF